MNDKEIRESQSLTRVCDLAAENLADFPATSLGGQLLTELKSVVAELDTQGSAQNLGHGAAKSGTEAKRGARESLLRQMRAISDTAKTMESISPGITETFRIPKSNGDEALLNAARAYVLAATPWKAEFVKRELPDSFLTDLSNTITEFENAINTQNINTGKRVNATAAIKDTLERGLEIKRQLDVIMRNKYRSDSAKLAAWESAHRIGRVGRRKKTEKTPTPPTT
jgi:hypothetical protein